MHVSIEHGNPCLMLILIEQINIRPLLSENHEFIQSFDTKTTQRSTFHKLKPKHDDGKIHDN